MSSENEVGQQLNLCLCKILFNYILAFSVVIKKMKKGKYRRCPLIYSVKEESVQLQEELLQDSCE